MMTLINILLNDRGQSAQFHLCEILVSVTTMVTNQIHRYLGTEWGIFGDDENVVYLIVVVFIGKIHMYLLSNS